MSTEPSASSSSGPETRRARVGLLVGFVALTIGTLIAYRSPATGTELSIYRATPAPFWVGVAAALLCGLLVTFRAAGRRRLAQGGYVLSGAAVLSVVALPMIRGYHFYGAGDSLSHLGWVRRFADGTLHPVGMRYPGIHSVSTILTSATELPDRVTVMLTVVVFFALFLVFVPLCVRAITGAGPALVAGVASALLLLPINNIGVHVVAYPTTQAIMFAPVVLYLALAYVVDAGDRHEVVGDVSAVGLLLGLSAFAMILLHPQQALNVLFAFAMIALLQYAYRRYRSGDHPIADHRPLSAQAGLFGLLFLLWVAPQERVRVAIADITAGLLSTSAPGSAVAQRSVSLSVLGGSLEELFVKLFGVSLVYVILATALGLAVLAGSVGRVDGDGTAGLQYLIVTGIPAAMFFLIFLLADAKTQYFRYFGFLMMVVTIFGAVALTVGLDRIGDLGARPTFATALGAVFAVFLVVQLLAFHPAPYIYQPNSQVVGAEMSGYETAMEERDGDVRFQGIDGGPRRYVDAYYGTGSETAEQFPGRRGEVPQEAFNDDLAANYDERVYVPVTDSDYQREIHLYDELRYGSDGFEQLDRSTEIDRVQSNGQFDLYLIEPDGTEE